MIVGAQVAAQMPESERGSPDARRQLAAASVDPL